MVFWTGGDKVGDGGWGVKVGVVVVGQGQGQGLFGGVFKMTPGVLWRTSLSKLLGRASWARAESRQVATRCVCVCAVRTRDDKGALRFQAPTAARLHRDIRTSERISYLLGA